MKPKAKSIYKKGDKVTLLNYSDENHRNCPHYHHFWVKEMNVLIDGIFKIINVSYDPYNYYYYYTLENSENSIPINWGFCEHWLSIILPIILPEELFEI